MRYLFLALSLALVLTGCAQNANQKLTDPTEEKPKAQSKVQSKPPSNKQPGKKQPTCKVTPVRHFSAENVAESMSKEVKGVDDAVAVFIDDELDVAVKVTNFNRFRMPEIRKETFQKLRTFYPEQNIHVSTDGKIFDLLDKLKKEEWSDQVACQRRKKLKDIEDKMKG